MKINTLILTSTAVSLSLLCCNAYGAEATSAASLSPKAITPRAQALGASDSVGSDYFVFNGGQAVINPAAVMENPSSFAAPLTSAVVVAQPETVTQISSRYRLRPRSTTESALLSAAAALAASSASSSSSSSSAGATSAISTSSSVASTTLGASPTISSPKGSAAATLGDVNHFAEQGYTCTPPAASTSSSTPSNPNPVAAATSRRPFIAATASAAPAKHAAVPKPRPAKFELVKLALPVVLVAAAATGAYMLWKRYTKKTTPAETAHA